jgi:hypothetical protein
LLTTIVVGLIICYRKTKLLDEENIAILECEEKAESLIWGRDGKFTFRDIVKATENFHENYCIGKGGFGYVYKVALPAGKSCILAPWLHSSNCAPRHNCEQHIAGVRVRTTTLRFWHCKIVEFRNNKSCWVLWLHGSG